MSLDVARPARSFPPSASFAFNFALKNHPLQAVMSPYKPPSFLILIKMCIQVSIGENIEEMMVLEENIDYVRS